jgi:hypothetical protein
MAVVVIIASGIQSAEAGAQLVQNGGFEKTTNGGGQLGYNTEAVGWSLSSSPGYAFLFTTGTADTTGANGQYGNLALWGTHDGGLNPLPVSQNGGNFVALDGDFQTAAITQTLNGLTVGKTYDVSFDYGYAQQRDYTGATKQGLTVCLGSTCDATPTLTNQSKGFTGWMTADFAFKASSSSEVLSFLATSSTPVPPFALVDGVSATAAVPELSSWVLMLVGFAGLGLAGRRRRARTALAA